MNLRTPVLQAWYATAGDLTLMLIGIFFSVVQGSTMPILGLVFGSMTNTFMRASIHVIQFLRLSPVYKVDGGLIYGNDTISLNGTDDGFELYSHSAGITMNDFDVSNSDLSLKQPITADEFTSIMFRYSMYYLYIGFAAFIASYLQTFCWEFSCERQTFNLRRSFFSQVLRQDTVWCDKNQHGELSNKLSDDLERIREGIGHKFSIVIQYIAMFISGLCVGLYAEWRLTCSILAISPFLVGTSAFMARTAATGSAREQLKYSIAAGIAEEVLTCIRTVAAFGGEKREIERYDIALEEGRQLAMQKYYVMSVGAILVFFSLYASYGFAFWFGTRLIAQGLTSPGKVFAVFFSVMSSAFSIGSILPYINTVSSAIGAATTIFEIIDRVPDIDPYSDDGLKPKLLDGSVKLRNVHFEYPTRPGVQVLKGLNVEIPSGKMVALIGSSGAGKSTIVSLIMRFYDVEHGEVLVDGHSVKQLNLKWLRNNIGIVSQEPILFGVTIAENIRYGREDVTMEEIIEAAKKANAHSFITDLPDDYDTQVGERGTQLSGGQKQRIAIARALVRDPKILLLDEATSALDSQSESIVQEALENAMKGRTTVVIAHRLSTIRNADLIYAMKNGVAVESGNHEELMAKKGLYYSLVMIQRRDVKDEELSSTVISDHDNKFNTSTTSLARIINSSQDAHDKESSLIKMALRLLNLNRKKWGSLILGILANVVMGLVTPIFAFFYGQIFATFELEDEAMQSTAIFWSLMFVLLGVASGVSMFVMISCMTTAVEYLVARLRSDSFRNILRQEISWLDNEDFSVGKLLTKLSRDAPLVKAASGLRVGQVFQSIATLTAALIIALVCGWKLTIILLVAVPILIYVGYKHTSQICKSLNRDSASMDSAGKIASEAVQNMKTVQSLCKELLFLDLYLHHLEQPYRESKKQAVYFSITYAVSQAVIFLLYAGAFFYGTRLIVDKDMTPVDVYRVFFALTFCATAVGNSMAFLQDLSRGRLAAKLIFQLMDKTSSVDPLSEAGLKPEIKGQVTFEKVTFSYPTREDVTILKGFSLTADPGQTVALVGGSGCGKSTVVSLLERFYKPDFGKICVDGTDIQRMNVSHLRAHIGIVTQEPILFASSIRDNIAYGRITFGEEVSDDDVMTAAKKANIHDFIVSLPLGYDTLCGDRGTQLSGGQKQRIALARALLRDPKILLLDEATSALDTESEKVVQDALDRAREGRTCIVIAHRLTTIQNADKIAVIHKGKVVEQGTHEELIALKGIYYELVKRQQV